MTKKIQPCFFLTSLAAILSPFSSGFINLNTFDLWSGGCELNPTISVFFTNSSSSSSSSAIATTWWIFFNLQYSNLQCPKTGWITTAKSNPQIDKSKNQKSKNCSFFRRVCTPFAWSFFNLVCSCFFKPSSFFLLHSSSPTWSAWPTTQKEICYINLLYLSLELTILKQFVILQQNSFCLQFEDLWILLPVLLLLLLSSSVASEREKTEENKQTKNRRKQMTIARLITKELTTP